ncbi:MAG: hypothetical protein AAF541_10995 [Pseudomonadota bacterium]
MDAFSELSITPTWEGFDRSVIKKKLNHVAYLDESRVKNIYARLGPAGRAILDVLPYLIHFNQASLPGYVKNCPAGIETFHPTQRGYRRLRLLIQAFDERVARQEHRQIFGLYLMGSAGSVGQNNSSDIDFWVCTEENSVEPLARKLELLSKWARELGVDLQGFAVHPQQFDGQPERTRSQLLLDEFYRSACRLAGRPLLWWVLPARGRNLMDKTDLVHELDQHRLLDISKFVHFGQIGPLTKIDLYAAGLHAIEQAFATPYKGLLKLGLLVAYAHGGTLLSEHVKQQSLYATGGDRDYPDVYSVLAQYLQDHFGSTQFWTLLQRAWLAKTTYRNYTLSEDENWQRVVKGWNLEPSIIAQARSYAGQSFSTALAETKEITQGIQNLATEIFALQPPAHDLPNTTLQQARRIRQVLDYFSGRPSFVLPMLRWSTHSSLWRIEFKAESASHPWIVREDNELVTTHRTLIEAVCWSFNNTISPNTHGADAIQNVQLRHWFRVARGALKGQRILCVNADQDFLQGQPAQIGHVEPIAEKISDACVIVCVSYPNPIGRLLDVTRYDEPSQVLELIREDSNLVIVGSTILGSQTLVEALQTYSDING